MGYGAVKEPAPQTNSDHCSPWVGRG
jgi:hypothetical protein